MSIMIGHALHTSSSQQGAGSGPGAATAARAQLHSTIDSLCSEGGTSAPLDAEGLAAGR